MAITIKVITLNVWGVFTPGAVQYRHERIAAIGNELSKGEYEVIQLQEVWTQSDYRKLCDKLGPVYPYTHYFHSGLYGTGCCVFSKHPILETFQHVFMLNGYFHKLQHGDWFGGKSISLSQIDYKGFRINFYNTHLHAQYDEATDEYLAHRVGQAHEMSQFIKMTSRGCDFVLVGGDFNLQPKDLGYKLITSNGNLQDSWLVQKAEPNDETGMTTDRPDNVFHCKHTHTYAPQGLRLDYWLFRANSGHSMECDKCYLTMRQIPGEAYPYSDHEALGAEFTLHKDDKSEPPERDSAAIEKHFSDAIPILDDGMKKVRANQVFFSVGFVIGLMLLFMISDIDIPYGLNYVLGFIKFLFNIVVAYFGWVSIIVTNFEMNGLTAVKKDINNLLKANPNKQ